MNSKDVLRKLYELKKTMPDLMIKELSYGLFSTVYVVAIETVCSTDRINDFILKFFGNKRNSAKKNININKLTKDWKFYTIPVFCFDFQEYNRCQRIKFWQVKFKNITLFEKELIFD